MYKYLLIFVSLIVLNFSNSYSVSLEKEVIKAPMAGAEQYAEKFEEKFFDFGDHVYANTIAEVQDNGYVLVLEDGSKWQIGWWYHGKVKNWRQGDTVHATYSGTYGSIKFSNTVTKQTARGALLNRPRYNNPNTLNISKIEDDLFLTLSDGGVFESKSEKLLDYDWQEGDVVFVLYNESNKKWPYQIWNFSAGWIIFHFNLVQEPEILCHPCN